MTTAATIISDALIEIGVIGAKDTPDAEDIGLCLRKLNQLLQRLSNSPLSFPTLAKISFPLTGLQSYTVGPTGSVVAARPLNISHATAVDANGAEYVVDVISRQEWDGIAIKNVDGGPPSRLYYSATTTNGTAYVYPQTSGYTLSLHCTTLLASYANSAATVTLPEGYESLLTLMLADDVATAFGKQTSPDTRRRLAAALKGVQRTNSEPLYLDIGLCSRDEFEIERGY
jgi:hypothetical protein